LAYGAADAMVDLPRRKKDPAITKTDHGATAQEDGKRLVEISNIFKQEFGTTSGRRRFGLCWRIDRGIDLG